MRRPSCLLDFSLIWESRYSGAAGEVCYLGANCRFQFHKRSQLFIRMHNKTLSVIAMCVRNPYRSPVGINR